ncbi:hypothetical protein BH24BAC1_BH24BAC1_04200 [soil metagenome]
MNEFEKTMVTLVSDLMADVRGIKSELVGVKSELVGMKSELVEVKFSVQSMDKRLSNVENQLPKINAQLQDNTRAVMRLADELIKVMEHERRISRIEERLGMEGVK